MRPKYNNLADVLESIQYYTLKTMQNLKNELEDMFLFHNPLVAILLAIQKV